MAYIERESAIKSLLNDCLGQVSYSREDAADCIRYMDAADVVPVRHGRWVHEHISEGYAWVMCSECEAVIHKILIRKRLNYCPNCGARMDGVDDE